MSRLLALLTAFLTLSPASLRAADAWVALVNATDHAVAFRIDHPERPGGNVTLAAGETRAVPAGRTPEIHFATSNKPDSRFALEPFGVYAFVSEGESVAFQGVELAARMPKPDDLAAEPTARPALKIPVILAYDAAERRTRQAWERDARTVIAEANALLAAQVNLTLDVTAVETWNADARSADLPAALADLTKRVPVGDARLVIGFTSRPLGYIPKHDKQPQFAAVSAPLNEHILVRDGVPPTQAARAEVLVQAIGHWLGAAGAPDTRSVMRPKLGDGLADLTKFRVQFDPFNALAVNIVANELRGGTRSLEKLSPESRARLAVLYKSILTATPADPATLDAIAAIDPAAPRVAAAPPDAAMPDEQPKPAASPADPRRAAIRAVVSAIRLRAQVVRDLPAGDRPRGDKLTDDLVRTAADVAATAGGSHAATAFAVGLGIGLDDSTTLRDNLITRDLARTVESDAEFRERVSALGRPTVRGRRDLCQHFAVSCALTEILGAKGAELAGLTKELRDLGGESGFSFVDLLADFAGVAFAEKLLADPQELGRVRTNFTTESRVPPIVGLRENLTGPRFEADYGGLSDPRLKTAVAEVRGRVAKHLGGK